MDIQIRKDTHILCEKIRLLTEEIDKKLNNSLQGNIKLEINDIVSRKPYQKPAAGRRGTKWNGSIINWKNSLRHRF